MVNRILHKDDLSAFAREVAGRLVPGMALLLKGELGAGKSALSRAILCALAGDPDLDVASPTFPICLTYDTAKGQVWHYDLYRLPEGSDLSDLGWDEARLNGIAIVEWPERARKDQLRKPYIRIDIGFTDAQDTRTIEMETYL